MSIIATPPILGNLLWLAPIVQDDFDLGESDQEYASVRPDLNGFAADRYGAGEIRPKSPKQAFGLGVPNWFS